MWSLPPLSAHHWSAAAFGDSSFGRELRKILDNVLTPDFGSATHGQTATSHNRKPWSIRKLRSIISRPCHLIYKGRLHFDSKVSKKSPVSPAREKWALARRLERRISRVETCNFDSNYFQSNRIFMRLTLSKWSACGFCGGCYDPTAELPNPPGLLLYLELLPQRKWITFFFFSSSSSSSSPLESLCR